MGNPIFRFTLRHDIEGSLEITEPDGWLDSKLKLERHEDFHSLVEYFEGAFIFYGNNGVDNGGIDFVRFIEQNYGADATLNIDIEVSFDSAVTYEFIFVGQLDLTTINELKDNRAQIAIIRDDFWAKFISRKSTPVDLQATNDLDEAVLSPVGSVYINLPSQKLRYNGSYNWTDTTTYPGALNYHGLQLDWDEVINDDIRKFTLPRVPIDIGNVSGTALNLIGNFEAPWAGDYLLDIRFEAAELGGGNWFASNMNAWVQNPAQQTQTDFFTQSNVTIGPDTISIYTYNKTLRLNKGDQVTIYADRTNATDTITIFGNHRITWKTDAGLATTGNITLSGEQTIDGTLTSSSRVLVKSQGNPEENGIYTTAAGLWTRVADADTSTELVDIAIFITGGNLNANTAWMQVETGINLGVTPITWVYATPSDERFATYPGTSVDNHLLIQADTVYKSSRSEGMLIHDAAAAILNSYGLGVDNPFYSEFLGGLLTNARVYEEDGCGWHYNLIRGLQLRGYTLDEKQFSASFDHWWKGANPILNLGLGYDEITVPIDPGWEPVALPPLNFWGIADTSAQAWFWTGGIANPFLTVPSGITSGTNSDWFRPAISFEVGRTYKYELQFTAFSDVADPVYVSIVIGDPFFTILEQLGQTVIASPAGVSGIVTLEFVAPASAQMAVIANYPSGSGNDGSIVIDSFIDLTESIPPGDGTAPVIEVEEKEDFYDPIPSVYFDYVFEISREYDDDRIFNKIEIGYANWQSEDISGIDDPQTKHTYATRFKKIGKGIELHSDFIAASLAIEVTRRQTIEKSKDYKFDNNTFIISLNPDDVSPDSYQPELDENYDSITNLLNSETRYNPGLTPARNFLRWINYLNIGLAAYQSSVYKFTSGEGNYDMTSEMIPNVCGDDFGGEVLSEKQNIPVTSDRLHISMLYTIEINLAWDDYVLMRDNRKKAIGISQTNANHTAFFIKSLEYELCKGKATIKAWPKEYFAISQTAFTKQMVECVALGECGTGALDRTTSDGEGRVTSDGQCRTIA